MSRHHTDRVGGRADEDVTATRAGNRESSSWPLVAICVGYFMVVLDTMVVNVALPVLSRSLHTTTTGLQWVVDAYGLVFAALLLLGGALGDRRGAKVVYQAGMAIFSLASLACSLATTTGLLVAARCAQGLGAALAVPSSLSLLRDAYPNQAARRRAFGIWGAVAGVAAGAGPVVGGALVAGLGWRSVFLVNVPFGAGGLLVGARFLPSPPRRRHGVDPAGQFSGVVSVLGLRRPDRGRPVGLVLAGGGGQSRRVRGGGRGTRRHRAPGERSDAARDPLLLADVHRRDGRGAAHQSGLLRRAVRRGSTFNSVAVSLRVAPVWPWRRN